MKYNYEEVIESLKNDLPENCSAVGLCHPDTFKELFDSPEKAIISPSFYFMQSDVINNGYVLLCYCLHSRVEENDFSYQIADYQLIQLIDDEDK